MLDTDKIKQDFPIFKLKVNKKPLIYLDNAASTQMPEIIIKKLSTFLKVHQNRRIFYQSRNHRRKIPLSQFPPNRQNE